MKTFIIFPLVFAFLGKIMTRKDLDWFQTVFLGKISSVDGLILELLRFTLLHLVIVFLQ